MIFWIVTIILILIILFWTIEEGFGGFLMAGFVAGIVWIASGLLMGAMSGGAPVYKIETSTTNLRAASNGNDRSGSFFLGSGNVKDEKMFSYLYEEDGWTRSDQQRARDSFVAEDANSETARLDTVKIYRNYWWVGQSNIETRYEFHIPKNSVVENFKIEAK